MKPIACLVGATVAVALAVPVHAQVDCADWDTLAFFEAAAISDVTRCLQAGADPNVLPLAAAGGNAGAVMALLEAGANLEARTGGLTPLHLAASSGGTEAVMALLEAAANLEARRTEGGGTPLHLAAFNGSAETVMALLKAGANLEARDESGQTPLCSTVLGGTERVNNFETLW